MQLVSPSFGWSKPRIILACLFFGISAASFSQPVGDEFAVPQDSECIQHLSSLAGAADGSFLVTWDFIDPFERTFSAIARAFSAQGVPTSGDLTLSQHSSGQQLGAVATALPDGRFVVAWTSRPFALSDISQDGDGASVWARFLAADGTFLSDAFQVNTTVQGNQAVPVIASNTDGSFVVLWSSGDDGQVAAPRPDLYFQRFDSEGAPQGEETRIQSPLPLLTDPRGYALAASPSGEFAVVATLVTPQGYDVWIQSFSADGQPSGAASKVNDLPVRLRAPAPSVTHLTDGRFVVAWSQRASKGGAVLARLFTASGLVGETAMLIELSTFFSLFDLHLAADDRGGFILSWADFLPDTPAPSEFTHSYSQRFDDGARPRGPKVRLNRSTRFDQDTPYTFERPDGEITAVWTSRAILSILDPPLPFCDANPSQDGSEAGIFGRRVPPLCAGDSALCLREERFVAQVIWRNPRDQNTGLGHSTTLTDESGAFWFFRPENLELAVKVLDGRALNGHFWVFYASLTDVEFDLVVTDRETGASASYTNPPFHLASRGDTQAFASVPTSSVQTGLLAFAGSSPAAPTSRAGSLQPAPQAIPPPDLLLAEQFTVTVSWSDPAKQFSGEGQAVALTGDTGAFWFFNPNNIELLVKVLDGRPINGHFWLFYASLTNVEFTLTVTDNLTGQTRSYHNPPFQFASRADTTAF